LYNPLFFLQTHGDNKMNFTKLSILMIMFISLIAISPVMAGNDQDAGAAIIGSGDGNVAIADNDYYNYVDVNKVTQENDGSIKGDHNTMVQVNANQQNAYDNRAVTDASTTNVFVPMQRTANYYGLDSGVVGSYVTSLYEGQSLVVMNDANSPKEFVSQPGDKFKYYVRSSVPVLAYVINARDADKAEWDIDCAPVYDPFMHRFDVGNIDKIFMNKFRSSSQQFEVTIEEAGRYALVIDTRVAHRLDGRMSSITDDSVEVTYFVESTQFNGTPMKVERNVIGVTDMYPILSNGEANTA
jgi:hypothetical protein